MPDLCIRIELLRQELRRRLLKFLVYDNTRFLGVALIVLGIALTTTPAGVVTLPPSAITVAAVGVLGLCMVFSIILLPLGLILL